MMKMGCLTCGSLDNKGNWICDKCDEKIIKEVKKDEEKG